MQLSRPPQAIVCLGYALCKVIRILKMARRQKLTLDEARTQKTWSGVKTYLTDNRLLPESDLPPPAGDDPLALQYDLGWLRGTEEAEA